MKKPDWKIGDRIQRVGWQLNAQGTIRDMIMIEDRILFLVEWDFRGMENDLTTLWADDAAPVINWTPYSERQ